MKKLAKILVLAAIAMTTITGCKKLPDFSSSTNNSGTVNTPSVYTETVKVDGTTAYFYGYVANAYLFTSDTLMVGFYWNTTGDPTVDDYQYSTEMPENGGFGYTVSGLDPNTTYYVKAWAYGGTYSDYYYGDEMSFTTSGETSKY